MMRCLASVMFGLMFSLLAGCVVTGASGTERVQWPADGAELGRVAMLIHLDHAVYEREPERKDAEVREIVDEIMSDRSFAIVADEQLLQQALGEANRWPDVSEHELIEAARRTDLDTVGLITVERYGGDVWVLLLPPGWMANTYVRYRLRLLDVKTGRVIADVSRHRWTRGYLAVRGRHWLPRDLRADLAEAFAPALREPEKSTRRSLERGNQNQRVTYQSAQR